MGSMANATRQALEIAGAKNERRLFPVACTRLLGGSACAPPHMWKEQASPRVSCYPPGETVGRRDRPRIGAVCPFVRLVSGGGDHITGDRPRPDPVWETACFSVPPAPTAVLHLFPATGGCHDTPQRLCP